jgi:hypothetical protein
MLLPTDNEQQEPEALESDTDISAQTPTEEPGAEEQNLNANGLTDGEQRCILSLFENYRNEEKDIREMRIAFWKKLENYFDGIQNIFFDYGARDWRRLDVESPLFDPNLYDKIVNIYRAHGESLIAALSIRLPRAIFYPEDSDVVEDIDTAKACNDIKEIIEKDNNGVLLFVKALYFLWNQGVACAYIYNRASNEFGTVSIPEYGEDVPLTHATYSCPACGQNMGEEDFKVANPPIPEIGYCDSCGEVALNVEKIEELLPQVIGYTDESKTRTIIDVFGPMYAQMPFYARKQEQIPYLMLRFEQHQNMLRAIYKSQKDLIAGESIGDFDRIARTQNQNWDSQKCLVTTSCCWFRPWAYECLPDKDVELLKAKFPDGCYAVVLNDKLVAEARNEDLDDHWVITHSPLSNFIHADPIGKPLAPIQDIRNEATDLAIETFEHSIPETFVDPDVLNFTDYGNSEARPGTKYPAKPKAGKTLQESFHTIKTATVNEEIEGFIKRTDIDGQFVVGDFPSVYGGNNTSGSKTAKEYSESRAAALQRLGIHWSSLKDWWARVMSCAVQQYIKGMITDEKIVKQAATTTGYTTIWIRQSELTGKIGRVEADAEEELPTSFAQVKGLIMELITLQSPEINEALFHPQNTPLITKAIGIPTAYIPGADDRNKQYGEIVELLQGAPGIDGAPSVMVNPQLDNHEIEMETIRAWANSPTGLATKKMNPIGYANVLAHYSLHEMALSAMQPQVTPEGNTESKPAEKPEAQNV